MTNRIQSIWDALDHMEIDRKSIGTHVVSIGKRVQRPLNPLESICNLWGIYPTPYGIHKEFIIAHMESTWHALESIWKSTGAIHGM